MGSNANDDRGVQLDCYGVVQRVGAVDPAGQPDAPRASAGGRTLSAGDADEAARGGRTSSTQRAGRADLRAAWHRPRQRTVRTYGWTNVAGSRRSCPKPQPGASLTSPPATAQGPSGAGGWRGSHDASRRGCL
jgi:hypothetical protein